MLRDKIGVEGAHECVEIDLISNLSRKSKERKCWFINNVAGRLKLQSIEIKLGLKVF